MVGVGALGQVLHLYELCCFLSHSNALVEKKKLKREGGGGWGLGAG